MKYWHQTNIKSETEGYPQKRLQLTNKLKTNRMSKQVLEYEPLEGERLDILGTVAGINYAKRL
jgi:hypothetical protein